MPFVGDRHYATREGESALDTLTHTLTGLALSRAGLNRLTPGAPLLLMAAANMPDIDILAWAGGPLSYLELHRGWSHSLMAIPLLATLPAALTQALSRRRVRLRAAYLAALAGVASHVALDATNAWGVRLLSPFSGAWFRLDAHSLLDVWIWLALLISVAAPWLSRLVGSEIGARPRAAYPGRVLPIAALSFLVLYTGLKVALHERAVLVLDSRLYEDAVPRQTAAFPQPGNPFRWNGVVESDTAYHLFDLNLLGSFDPAGGRLLYKPQIDPAIAAAGRLPVFQGLLEFAQFPYWRVTPAQPDGWQRVEAMDLRFGQPAEPRFLATALLDPRHRVQRAWFEFGLRR
ncbi:MAG: metal-dependent hydrolase [Bryobacterales bacterium]|nr:metal-dependent hydrolase [Bryobacterales bacterium]